MADDTPVDSQLANLNTNRSESTPSADGANPVSSSADSGQSHDANPSKILELTQKKEKVKNIDLRDYLRVSQSTVSDYLHTLVSSGKIKKEGKGYATYYTR